MQKRRPIGRRMAVRLAGALGFTGVGVAAVRAVPGRGAMAAGGDAAIVGTWQILSPGPTTHLLQTYSSDGSHLSIHDEHPTRSPQLGSWVQVGPRDFLMRNISFTFDATGRPTGSVDVRAVYTVSSAGDTMTGRGIRFPLDTNGNVAGPTTPWEARGVRITPVPID